MNAQTPREFLDRRQLVSALRSLRRGDFTVRLPEDGDGLDGEIASLFNEVVGLERADDRTSSSASRKVVGKEGKISQRGRVRGATRRLGSQASRSVNELIEDMVQPTAEVARVIGAVAKGDLSQIDDGRDRRPPAARRVPAHRQGRQHDGRAARLLRLRSDPRGARGRHRGQARRPGAR